MDLFLSFLGVNVAKLTPFRILSLTTKTGTQGIERSHILWAMEKTTWI